jgi:hypothetical protein
VLALKSLKSRGRGLVGVYFGDICGMGKLKERGWGDLTYQNERKNKTHLLNITFV